MLRVLAASLLLVSVVGQAPPSPARVSLIFGGDVIPHGPVKWVASLRAKGGQDGNNQGWDHLLGPLTPVLQRADFALVNLESPIVALKKPEAGGMLFSAPPALLGALKRAGVDVATFANNHCLDQHREGIVSTRQHLAEAGLLSAGADVTSGAAWTPLVLEKRGIRVGILAITRWLNGFNNKKDEALPHVPAVPYEDEPIIGGRSVEELLSIIRQRATEVDALIISIHWGMEYQAAPSARDRKLAQQMLDAGAFAIIGHHPHVLQPVEFLERSQGGKGLVVFSLGNLLSNQDFDDAGGSKRDGLLLELELEQDGPGALVRLASLHGVAVSTENTFGRGRKRNLQAVLLDDEVAAIRERLADLADRAGRPARNERQGLQARLKVALARRARIGAFLPPGMLELPGEARP